MNTVLVVISAETALVVAGPGLCVSVSVIGHTVVYSAMVSVITEPTGQFVTSGGHFVTVYTDVVDLVLVIMIMLDVVDLLLLLLDVMVEFVQLRVEALTETELELNPDVDVLVALAVVVAALLVLATTLELDIWPTDEPDWPEVVGVLEVTGVEVVDSL